MNDAAAADAIISEEMRALTGKVLNSRSSYPISASDIRKWAKAVYHPEPPPAKYLGVGAAGGETPLEAPQEFSPFAWGTPGAKSKPADISASFIENAAGVKPPPMKFMVNGGAVVEYGAPMREGDVITAANIHKGYTIKQGKKGPLLITETEDRWTNQKGEVVRKTHQTLVRY